MSTSDQVFASIVADLTRQDGVTVGRMMRAPGLKFRNKVFAFRQGDSMTFKLGDPGILEQLGIDEYRVLSPFKTKPPLRDWLVVDRRYQDKWPELARIGLHLMRGQL
ncbi:MAG: hypothetical protein KDC43_19285 [Saprospiraceae bacterium]|nr:hypothetical protein [Saprospiraceae bacterium]MCB0625996.1 hypothetical protein [Saprospiraceae bacterium]MCB0675714.1 hypothetical protein [Saprospiraceae bacterium]MCB0684259.1 hypothetical protein [Saprospiraceae bacterium]